MEIPEDMQEAMERYRQGHENRVYGIPIIKDNSDQVVEWRHPDTDNLIARLGPNPDRVVGYRFYLEQNGVKSIIETRAGDLSDYNLLKIFYRDWDERDVMRNSIDSKEVLT